MEPPAFWLELKQITDCNAKPKFDVLSELMCTLVALPHSSACVELIFSQVNIVKTKQCNKLMCETVSNRLLARQAVKKGGACHSWNPYDVTVWWKIWGRTLQKALRRDRAVAFTTRELKRH